jgi:hypothetical protein
MFFSFLTPSLILTCLNLASAVALVVLAYYSLMIFFHMRLGRLERGWKLITQGIFFMSSGFLFVAIDHSLPRASTLYIYIDSIGVVLTLVGIVIMLVGLHSHYVVWYKKTLSKETAKETETSVDDHAERPKIH